MNIFNNTCLKRGYGTIDELLKEIPEKDLKHLLSSGYIRCGISAEGETFSLTIKGKKMKYFYSDRISIKDKIISILLNIF